MNWLWIGFGGALGAISRYSINLFFAKSKIPIATLVVNSVGSFLFGLLMAVYADKNTSAIYLFMTAGFFGAFTTFSTFTYEVVNLLNNKKLKKAIVFVILHFFIIVTMIIFGFISYKL